jgi:hypothetical protein
MGDPQLLQETIIQWLEDKREQVDRELAAGMAVPVFIMGIIYLSWEEKVEKLANWLAEEKENEVLLKSSDILTYNFLMGQDYGIKDVAATEHRLPIKAKN